jgi:ParB family transcriptional regulator, chromosome partitioning protein
MSMSTANANDKPAPKARKTTRTTKTPEKTTEKKTTTTKAKKETPQVAKPVDSSPEIITIPSDTPVELAQLAPQMVSLAEIVLPESQPRRYFDPKAMESLVTSIKREGILQPVLLRLLGNKRELVAGERRYKAAEIAGLTEIPAIIRQMSDEQAKEYALAENLQREDLNPVEETEAILDLLALKLKTNWEGVISLLNKLSRVERGQADNNVRQDDRLIVESMFEAIGKISKEAFRVHRLPLLNLPEDILQTLRAGKIEYTKAKEIAKLELEEERKQLLSEAIEFSLSFAEIHKRVLEKKPKSEQNQLRSRLEDTYKQAKKLKLWDNPKKKKKLESLLTQLEALLTNEN